MHAEAAVDRRARAAASLRGGAAAPPRRSRSSPRCRPTCPAAPPGLPLVLADGGVRYLAVAHNWASRATPHLTGGESLPRAFHWGTASGKRVLVWHTDSPHGIAYLEGNLLGLADSYADAHDLLPEYLAALVVARPPLRRPARDARPPGGRPRAVPVRPAAPARPGPARRQRRAEPSPGPDRGRLGARVRLPAARPVHEPRLLRGASKRSTAPSSRRSAATGPTGGPTASARPRARSASTAAPRPRCGRHRRCTSWPTRSPAPTRSSTGRARPTRLRAHGPVRRAHLVRRPPRRPRAHRLASRPGCSGSRRLRSRSRHAIARRRCTRRPRARFRRTERAFATRLDSILVLNPSGRARTDLVELFVPAGRVDSAGRLAVVDVERGERVPHALGAPEPSRNRPQGRLLSFVARDVPALGYRRFELVADGAAQPAVEPGPVENEHYRVELDAEGGYALRLVDLELGHDLVDAASAFGFGQVVRDLYGGPLHATARARPGAELTYAPPDGARSGALILSRTTPVDGIVRERVSSPVEERITTADSGRRIRGGRDDLPPRARRAEARRHRAAPEAGDRREGERSRRLPVCCARPVRRLRADRRRRRRRVGPRRRRARPRDPPLGRPPGRLRDRRLEHARCAARPARERLPPLPALPCDDRRRGRRPGHFVGDEQRLGHELPADAGGRDALRLRSLLRRARRRRALARDRDRGRAHPTARRRPRGNRRSPGRNGVRAGRPGRRGRDARCYGGRRSRAPPPVVRRGRGRRPGRAAATSASPRATT